MNLKNSLRGQSAIEYILLATLGILLIVKGVDVVSKLKNTSNGLTTHFNTIKSLMGA